MFLRIDNQLMHVILYVHCFVCECGNNYGKGNVWVSAGFVFTVIKKIDYQIERVTKKTNFERLFYL